jgi:hypothetical protein
MTELDRLVPTPRLVEIDRIDLGAAASRVWEAFRHGDLARSPLVRALFAIRTLPSRLKGDKAEPGTLRVDDLISSPERPGFRVLAENPPHEFAVGAIGKVWQADIPFVYVANAEAFAAFRDPGFVKVAWAVRATPHNERDTHVEVEVRVDATDDESWEKFRRYFRVIGPGSRFIRHSVLKSFARELGAPEARDDERSLPGDDLIPDAGAELTHSIDIAAPPEAIWPWLVQMGCRRAGFYSIDILDNAAVPSASEIHLDLQRLLVGEVIPATPKGHDGFEVLRVEAPHVLSLGGLHDVDAGRQIPFASPRPRRFWHVSWTFVLEPLDAQSTRLLVRARAAFPPSERLHVLWIRPVHHLMQTSQLRHLAARAEGRLPRDPVREVIAGAGGAAIMTAATLTPFLRGARNHWGLDARTAARRLPGDDLIPEPRWSWTHGIEIEAPAEEVWPWIAQVGADRGGFYSYQWLENIAGSNLRNAETIHPEWQLKEGDPLVLHPEMPALPIVSLEPGRYFVAYARADERARAEQRPWIESTWLFLLEPLGPRRCRFISRFRGDSSDDIATRLSFGSTLVEPVGFAMDRRMLMGVKERAERAARSERSLRAIGPRSPA